MTPEEADKDYIPDTFNEAQTSLPNLVESEQASPDSFTQGEWQPIETARMDGRRLILYSDDWIDIGYWDRDPTEESGQCWRYSDGERIELPPTHWMPLPEPPNTSEAAIAKATRKD